MPKYSFRPYYAYDCDSAMGFNNGHYLDELTVEAATPEAARVAALALLADSFSLDTVDADETAMLDVDAAWTFDHLWRTESGEELHEEPTDGDAECFYLYKCLDLGEAELVQA